MKAEILARKIAEKVKEEYDVVITSNFCDEIDVDSVPEDQLTETIKNVIIENCGKDLYNN